MSAPALSWATNSSSEKAHLVASYAVDEPIRTAPACSPGRTPKWWWSALPSKSECKRCLRIATKKESA